MSTARLGGLDVGNKRIGVAVSDGLGLTAQPVVVIERSSVKQDVAKIAATLAPYGVRRVVAGLPVEMSGREGEQARRVRAFCEALATATGLDVVYQDERMTTVQSERILVESGVRRGKRREVIDKLAATLILQAYLDARGTGMAGG
jgi:putative Holliday junction resolvase